MGQPEVIARWEVPHPDALTMAELDEVLALTGIRVDEAGMGVTGKVLAALVTWTRCKAGDPVTFDEVYRTLRGNQVRLSTMDPTSPPG